jgi:antitoxin CcdA
VLRPRFPVALVGLALMTARSVDLESARRWLGDNADTIKAENDYIEKHGLPLSRHRLF